MQLLKRLLVLLGLLLITFSGYVIYVNRNSKDMTTRQKIMKALYPIIMWAKGSTSKTLSGNEQTPPVSFYTLTAIRSNGSPFQFETLKGKKVLLVNTASDCGFTGQFEALQQLQDQFKDQLVVIGFPANDFKEQEKGSDTSIEQFCKINYGVSFPIMQKSVVIKSAAQNPVYKWLTDASLNGWNTQAPNWNFSKYLISSDGKLLNYFDPSVSPLHSTVTDKIK